MTTLLLFGRTLLALGVVLGLVWALARLARRAQGGDGQRGRTRPHLPQESRRGPGISVLARRPLSRTAAVAVVRVGDRDLVVGTTSQSITLLTELARPGDGDGAVHEPAGPEASPDTPWMATSRQAPLAWDAVITTLREKSTRR